MTVSKIYQLIKSVEDAIKLQSVINGFHEWCLKWGLDCNPAKCSIISFTLKKLPIIYEYIH